MAKGVMMSIRRRHAAHINNRIILLAASFSMRLTSVE